MTQIATINEAKLWTKSYSSLLLVNLLLCFGFYMLPPTLPAYVKQIGGSNLQASLVFGMFSAMSLVARIIAGSIVEAKGEKTIIIIGIGIVALCSVAFFLLPVNGILLLRSLQGIGWGMATAAIATAVYKTVPEQKRGEGSGYYALTTIISLSLTPVAAILIMSRIQFGYVLIASVTLTVASALLLISGLTGLAFRPASVAGERKQITLRNVFEKGALLPSTLCFLLSIPLCGIMGYLMLFGREAGIDNVWLYFIGNTVMILLTRRFVGRLFDKRGHSVIIFPGSVLMIAGLITLAFTNSTAMLVFASLLYGLGYGAVQPSLQTWAVNRCPADRKGAANGLFLSSIDLGYMIGSIVLGYIAGGSSYAAMYGYSTIFMVAFIVIYVSALTKSSTGK
ncbi:MFS transporter [Anaerosporomusa subterranea]|uniref:MFS transporter n=1 Tax=Anaerosporomusa subterranea TaxID=1794912 RepID=UPI000AE72B63|nr:MFS transporter [Anaerosporomusa subterranea]